MAAALASRFPLFTDDLLAIEGTTFPPRAFPGPCRIKVHESVLPFLPEGAGVEMDEAFPGEKIVKPAAARSFPKSLPLERLFILEEGEAIAIEPITPGQAVIELVRHTYTLRPLLAGVNRTAHFRQCARVADQVSVRRLIRPRRLQALPAVVERVLADFYYG
jgi:hypothetical protein